MKDSQKLITNGIVQKVFSSQQSEQSRNLTFQNYIFYNFCVNINRIPSTMVMGIFSTTLSMLILNSLCIDWSVTAYTLYKSKSRNTEHQQVYII